MDAARVDPVVMMSSTRTTAPRHRRPPLAAPRTRAGRPGPGRRRTARPSPPASAAARSSPATPALTPRRRSTPAASCASRSMWSPKRRRAAAAVAGTGTSVTGPATPAPRRRRPLARSPPSTGVSSCRLRSLYWMSIRRSEPAYAARAKTGGSPGGSRHRPGATRPDGGERRAAGLAQRPGRRLVAARAGGGQHQVKEVGEEHGTRSVRVERRHRQLRLLAPEVAG